MSMVLFDGQRRQTELLSTPYNVIEIVLLAVMVIECLAKLTCALRRSHKKVFILFKSYSYVQLGGSPSLEAIHVSSDCLLTLLAIGLLIVEAFSSSPVFVGFLRLRCLLKLPFSLALLRTACHNKVCL
jgi:hypothetical protein